MSTIQSDESNAKAPETAGEKLAAKRAEKAARKAAARGTQNTAAEEVEKSVLAATSWFDEHGRTLVVVCGVGLALLAGYQFWSRQSRDVAEDAGDLFYAAVQTANGLVLGENEAPPEDALVPTFTSAKERDEKALREYRAVIKELAKSDAGRWAKLGEANTLLALGKHADAAKAFDTALAAAGEDAFLRFRSLEGASYALEAEGKRDEAQKKLEDLAKLDGGTYKPVAEYHRARLLVASGKRDEARKVLEAQAKAAEASQGTSKNGAAAATASVDRFPSVTEASETLLQELGGKPTQRGFDLSGLGGPGGLSPDVIESLRRQLSQQEKAP